MTRPHLFGFFDRYFRLAPPILLLEWHSILQEISTSATAVRTKFTSSIPITILSLATPGQRCLIIRSFCFTWVTDHNATYHIREAAHVGTTCVEISLLMGC